jgi:hypothetical protein
MTLTVEERRDVIWELVRVLKPALTSAYLDLNVAKSTSFLQDQIHDATTFLANRLVNDSKH